MVIADNHNLRALLALYQNSLSFSLGSSILSFSLGRRWPMAGSGDLFDVLTAINNDFPLTLTLSQRERGQTSTDFY
ncbi:MAG TPA: hypothetical protein DIW81_26585 [Planctomycetaceae bacterium]|nr:hypothetical protein [Rubinisphaera sp.]HCS55109.1 hypothetical protein [Planctomycetaceae bacterium]|tara:strand:- start:7303 stop:7530 length:228 start_codon:yes stop_codon:yes gene_type:complete